MGPSSLAHDTDPSIHQAMVQSWRELTIEHRVALLRRMNSDVQRLALAGIAASCPDLSTTQVAHELASRRYGKELADEAYADLLTT